MGACCGPLPPSTQLHCCPIAWTEEGTRQFHHRYTFTQDPLLLTGWHNAPFEVNPLLLLLLLIVLSRLGSVGTHRTLQYGASLSLRLLTMSSAPSAVVHERGGTPCSSLNERFNHRS